MKQIADMTKKNWKIIGGVAVLVIIVVVVLLSVKKKEVVDTGSTIPLGQQEVPVETPVVTPSRPRPSTTTTVVDTRTYTDMILAYKNRTIQFNSECQVPALPTRGFKRGTDILLDNRSSQPVRITLGNGTHQIAGYGYKTVSLDTVGTFRLDCNDRQNVTTIVVQQ